MPPRSKRIEDRFWTKVENSDLCWLWAARVRRDGYGWIRDSAAKGRNANNLPPVPRGERHWNAQLTDADIAEIRRLRAEGMSGMNIAGMIGKVSRRQIYRILSGERWANA